MVVVINVKRFCIFFRFLFIQQQKNTHYGNEIYSLWITTGQLQNNSDVDQTIYQPIDQLVCVVYLSMFFFSHSIQIFTSHGLLFGLNYSVVYFVYFQECISLLFSDEKTYRLYNG